MRWLALACASLGIACGKVSIDAEGKGCPCPSERGLTCDSVCQVCVPKGTTPGASCAGNGGGSGGGGCTPKLGFSNFRPAWVTPNSIYWMWDPDTEDKQSVFQSYRLELTPTLPAGELRTYDASTHPELGLYVLPNDGADLTSSALITDLTPEVQYSARLIVRDVSGCEFSLLSEAPQTHAKTSPNPIEIFGESGFSGETLGGSVVSQNCAVGTSCVQMDSCTLAADSGLTKCCDNLRVRAISIDSNISNGQFEQAYLELYAKNDSSAPVYFSSMWLRIGAADSGDNRHGVEGWTFAATGEYRRLQFPLRELTTPDGTKLDSQFLAANDIQEFNWYTCLTSGASAWFDEVYIRW